MANISSFRRYCGVKTTPLYLIFPNCAIVGLNFRTDSSLSYRGFNVSYTVTDTGKLTDTNFHSSILIIPGKAKSHTHKHTHTHTRRRASAYIRTHTHTPTHTHTLTLTIISISLSLHLVLLDPVNSCELHNYYLVLSFLLMHSSSGLSTDAFFSNKTNINTHTYNVYL